MKENPIKKLLSSPIIWIWLLIILTAILYKFIISLDSPHPEINVNQILKEREFYRGWYMEKTEEIKKHCDKFHDGYGGAREGEYPDLCGEDWSRVIQHIN